MKYKNNVLLIGGSGRSGTTFLSNIFSSHPDICNVPESRFLIDPDGLIDFYESSKNSWSPYHHHIRLKRLVQFLNKLERLSFGRKSGLALSKLKVDKYANHKMNLQYHNLSIESFCPDFKILVRWLEKELTYFSFQGQWVGMQQFEKTNINYGCPDSTKVKEVFVAFLDQYIFAILKQQNVQFYLEKNTWNILWFNKILDFLPTGKLVHIYRDPRDVVASFTRQKWMPSDPFQAATIYKDLMLKWQSVKSSIPADSFYEMSLEQLVDSPEETIRNICSFWNISFHQKLLDISLSKSNKKRYVKEFSSDTLKGIEKILAPVLSDYAYA